MAKIADLVVQLTAETASFRRDLDSARKQVKDFGDGITGTFGRLQSIVTTGIQAFGASLAVNFVKHTTEAIDSLGKLSQKIGISVEDLSTLRHAAAVSDVPLETLSTGIGLLSRAMAGFTNDENKGASAALERIGINARTSNGELRPTADVLLEIADKFAAMRDGADKTSLAMQLFGRSGKELIPLLNQGSAGIKQMQQEARDFGLKITGATAKAAEEFNDNLTRLEASARGLASALVAQLLPSLNRITDGLVEASKQSAELSSITAIGQTINYLIATFSSLVAIVRVLYDYLGNFFRYLGATVQLLARGDFAGLKELDRTMRAELLDPIKDAAVEVRGIWATALGGIKEDTAKSPKISLPAPTVPKVNDAALQAYLRDLEKAKNDFQSVLSIKPTDPFVEASEDFRHSLDNIQADLAKLPDLEKTGIQRIGGAAEGVMRDYLTKIETIGKQAQEEIDKILAKAAEHLDLSAVPIITPTRTVTLSKEGQLKELIDGELKAIQETDKLNRELDEILLHTKKASAGAYVFFRQYAEYATNAANATYEAFSKIFSALEDQLTNLLANFKFDFDSFFKSVRESIARAVVQTAITGPLANWLSKQGGIFGKIGQNLIKKDGSTEAAAFWVRIASKTSLSKDEGGDGGGLFGGIFGGLFGGSGLTPDGTAANPFHVIVDDSSGGLGGGAGDGENGLGGIGKIFSSIGSFFGKIGSAILSAFKFIGSSIGKLFGGGFVDGGFLPSGQWGIAGERGPEPIFAGRTGLSVIPNHVAFGRNPSNANITQNFYLTPTARDNFGYSSSQLATATYTGALRAAARS